MTAQFKVGSVYRDSLGRPYRLYAVGDAHAGQCEHKNAAWAKGISKSGLSEFGQGFRSLIDGRDLADYVHDGGNRDLLPGELHCVNGEWVPVAEEAPKPAERRFPGDQDFSGTTGPERARQALTWADSKRTDRFADFIVKRYDADEGMPAAPDHSHPLQRMSSESDPMHGSAFLRKGC